MKHWTRNSAVIPHHPGSIVSIKRIKVAIGSAGISPSSKVIRSVFPSPQWAIYFAYSPSGSPYEQHKFSISRLQSDGFKVLVVLAAKDASTTHLWRGADALIWKSLEGFDMSALGIGMKHIVENSSSSDVVWMNDSVFGPLHSISSLVKSCAGRVIGFTQSFAVEPHIQSYSIYFRNVDSSILRSINKTIYPWLCFSRHGAVSYIQETRLSRVLGKQHSITSLWTPINPSFDLNMAFPFELVGDGYPFLKRSILGKFKSDFNQSMAKKLLLDHGHPVTNRDLFEGFEI